MNLKTIFGGTDTVDSIVASFETQKEKLKGLAVQLKDAAAKHQADADALLAQSKEKADEALRASRVAAKIGELIG